MSIVEATCDAARRDGVRPAGLLGTRFTMLGRFYPRVFAGAGIEVVSPDHADQEYVLDKYVNELLNNVFTPTTREGIPLLDTTAVHVRAAVAHLWVP